MPSPNRLTSFAASTPFESKRLYSPLSGSESDRSSDLDSIGSYRGSPSPEPAEPEHHQASIRSKLIAYLDYPAPLSGFFYHPVTSEQFWSLRDTSEFREVLEGRGWVFHIPRFSLAFMFADANSDTRTTRKPGHSRSTTCPSVSTMPAGCGFRRDSTPCAKRASSILKISHRRLAGSATLSD